MATLDGFKTFDFSEGVPYVSVTSNGVTFNRSVVLKLGKPATVRLLIDEETQRIAVQVCDASDKHAVAFFKEKANNVISVRWSSRDLLNCLSSMMGWTLERNSYRVEGIFLKEDNAILFDFTNASELK